uniref:Sema domain-containing protein n=1 Tax=Scophthalmus maximus TaxID=52904 RepID=A0A8D3CD99_SCOMX
MMGGTEGIHPIRDELFLGAEQRSSASVQSPTSQVKMRLLFQMSCLLFLCLDSLTNANSTLPRMIFTDQEAAVKRLPVPGHHAPVRILLKGQSDSVTAAGTTHLYTYNFQHPQTAPVERKVSWKECMDSTPQEDCSYNITVVHEREANQEAFVCGTNGRETLCCTMNMSARSPTCSTSDKMRNIEESIRAFIIKEGEPSALMESAESADLYITHSGSQEYVGIHKFGKHRVGPAPTGKEQHFVGLMLSRRRDDSLQDRVYAFYKEKNSAKDMDDDMWLPFVTQACMADIGGPKNILQLRWTSQMNARLFCGDPDAGQQFSELVDVSVVHADQWQDTRVYGLFRNEWGMSAVCVYTIHDIDDIFTTSPFKGVNPKDKPRRCVKDSTKISPEILRNEKTSEMQHWVQPVNKSGPLLFNHHNYTHIYADGSLNKRADPLTVLFLSLGTHCRMWPQRTTPACPGPLQKVFRHPITARADDSVDNVILPSKSKYIFLCPVLSNHAQHSWRHLDRSRPCWSKDQWCLLHIDGMSPEHEGPYMCVSEELGFTKVLARYNLRLEGRAAGRSPSPLVWVCLVAALITSFSCQSW